MAKAKPKAKPARKHSKKPSAVRMSDNQRFQADQDLRSLREVEAIKGDKPRLQRAKKLAQQEVAAIKKASEG